MLQILSQILRRDSPGNFALKVKCELEILYSF